MTREEAVKILRKENPNKYVYSGFELDDKYVFVMSVDEKKVDGDTMQYGLAVDKITKKVSFFNIRQYFLEIAIGKRPQISKEKTFAIDDTH